MNERGRSIVMVHSDNCFNRRCILLMRMLVIYREYEDEKHIRG